MTPKKTINLIIVLLLAIGAIYLFLSAREKGRQAPLEENPASTQNLYTYSDPAYGLSFIFPESWGQIAPMPGNSTCPQEDTYRTADTLHIFDRELRFPDKKLPASESMIRSGIRIYRMNPSESNGCNDELLRKLAAQEITGAEISSVKLQRVDRQDFYGVYNGNASRLDTEGRVQYTLFSKEEGSGHVLIIQPYMSFIPWSASPEWQEIDTKYPNDIGGYIVWGKTSEPIRAFIADFKKFAESITMEK